MFSTANSWMSSAPRMEDVVLIDQATWTAALGRLQVELTSGQFAAWLKNSTFVQGGDRCLVVGLPNAFAKETIERNFLPIIRRVVSDVANAHTNVTFVIARSEATRPSSKQSMSAPALAPARTSDPQSNGHLAPRHTFQNFIVGDGARLAHAAAQRVGESPGTAYNPLFIYGGVGLGKTHLLRAIGNAVLEQAAGSTVQYVTSEDFTHELVSAIRSDRTGQFRAKYRSVDVLLFDDIQFIAGRESTQQEVFHTFDSLHSTGKQIVLASDRSPQEIQPLSDRLSTRFACGLVADIQPPDVETRRAILQTKAAALRADVEPNVLDFLAAAFTDNVRQLEGALTRVIFYAQCNRAALTVDVARQALSGLNVHKRGRALTLDDIVNAVARHFVVTAAELVSPSRESRLTRPRHIAMHIMRKDTPHSLPSIGAALGGRDHTTVLHGCRKITDALPHDPNLRATVEAIRTRLTTTT